MKIRFLCIACKADPTREGYIAQHENGLLEYAGQLVTDGPGDDVLTQMDAIKAQFPEDVAAWRKVTWGLEAFPYKVRELNGAAG